MTKDRLIPHEQVFNFMIRREIPLDDSQPFDVLDWLSEMDKFHILPSINTFNAVFSTLHIDEVTWLEFLYLNV